MTEERKKYLASISEEERTIRNALKYNKGCLKECKRICSLNSNYYRWKEPITVTKSIIKSLKKQLPAPFWVSKSNTYYCPICGNMANNGREYCSWCGQKLR